MPTRPNLPPFATVACVPLSTHFAITRSTRAGLRLVSRRSNAFRTDHGGTGQDGWCPLRSWAAHPPGNDRGMVAEGMAVEEILSDYFDLEAGAIRDGVRRRGGSRAGAPPPLRRLRFLLDEGLSPRLLDLLRAAGHGVVHARHVGLQSAVDSVVLAPLRSRIGSCPPWIRTSERSSLSRER